MTAGDILGNGVTPDAVARADVLDRVREALRGSPPAPVAPRAYRRHGTRAAGSAEVVDLLVDRLEDYRADVVRCGPTGMQIGAAVRAALTERGAVRVVGPIGLPPGWLAERVVDDGLSPAELDAAHGVVTGCAVAIAETGTIVLDGRPACGRRAISLVPDLHVCVVRAQDVVETVPEGIALLDPMRPLTFVSGPSATSDIELSRVEGVHGPRTLVVVVASATHAA